MSELRQTLLRPRNSPRVDLENKQIHAALHTRINEAEAAKVAAEESGTALRVELDRTRSDHAATIQTIEAEAEANITKIRADAVKEAEGRRSKRNSPIWSV
jgi:hypothetical protein